MDRRHQATTLAAGLMLAVSGVALAQPEGQPAAGPEGGSNIFGSQELPKGLTIVPWKKGSVGDLTSEPTRLVEEPLEPIDPDEFQRRLDYYKQAQGQ